MMDKDMWWYRPEQDNGALVAGERGSDTLLLLTTQSTLTEYKTYRPQLVSQGAEQTAETLAAEKEHFVRL